jgi:LysM repeat protein
MTRLFLVTVLVLVVVSAAGPAQAAPRADTTYVVQPGDSPWRIASRFGLTAAALLAANGLAETAIIHPGQVLIIPGPGGPVSAGGGAAPSPAGAYTVQPGDSPARIAARLGVNFSAFMAANNLGPTSIIHPGQVLIVPGGGPAGAGLPPVTAPAAPAAPAGGAPTNHLGTERVVIADYMLWYDPSLFDGTKTWDVPAAGAYSSGDFGALQRHVAQAQQACLTGFAAHWYGPGEGFTTNNFNQLLAASAGTGLRHVVVIQANILPGASEQGIADAIRHALSAWAYGPNYLRLGERPVLIFTDMPRPWGSEAAALAGWARIRAAVDPNHTSIWMAEGLSAAYTPLFDGLYVYRIDHRDFPQSWLKQPRWAAAVRAVEARGPLPIGGLYFADTIAPGFDDTRSVNISADHRSGAPHFARDRRNGGYFADTFAVTSQTGGDFLFVKSFNEWVEGTAIEPGTTYGDTYLNLTCQYANAYRGR